MERSSETLNHLIKQITDKLDELPETDDLPELESFKDSIQRLKNGSDLILSIKDLEEFISIYGGQKNQFLDEFSSFQLKQDPTNEKYTTIDSSIRALFNELEATLHDTLAANKKINTVNKQKKLNSKTNTLTSSEKTTVYSLIKDIIKIDSTHPFKKLNKFIIEITESGEIKITDKKPNKTTNSSKFFSIVKDNDGELYATHETLGSGTEGRVKKYLHLNDTSDVNKFYALKIISSTNATQDNTAILPKELGISFALKRNKKNYTRMPFISGASMADLVYINKPNSCAFHNQYRCIDANLQYIMAANFIKALSRLHDNNILHRDVKLDNVIFDTSKQYGQQATFIDLNFATKKDSSDNSVFGGTPSYIAPEIDEAKINTDAGELPQYSTQSDIYAAGIALQEIFHDAGLNDIDEITKQMIHYSPSERGSLNEILISLYNSYLTHYLADEIPDPAAKETALQFSLDKLILKLEELFSKETTKPEELSQLIALGLNTAIDITALLAIINKLNTDPKLHTELASYIAIIKMICEKPETSTLRVDSSCSHDDASSIMSSGEAERKSPT